MDNTIFNNPLFQSLSPDKLQFLMNFQNQQKPQNINGVSALLSNTMNEAHKKGIQFTQEESSLLIQLLMQNMPESERQKAQLLISMMRKGK